MKEKDYSFTGYQKQNTGNAKRLRREMTAQEKKLWYDFLSSYPVKFYRQRPIDRFIADFYCSEAKLVIEIDGAQHFTEEALLYDKERSAVLERYGVQVIRFTNGEINKKFSAVCQQIATIVRERAKGKTDPSTA